MNRIIALCLCCFPQFLWACDYGDDPRLEKDAAALIQAIRSGKETGQINMTLATYLGMGPKSRALFGEQIRISSKDCKPVGVLDGDIIGTASMPFEDFYGAMARAIRKDQPAVAKVLMAHGKVAPMPVEQYVNLFGQLPYERTGGLKVRETMYKIFPAAGRLPPKKSALKDKSQQGRIEDYSMARLFKIFGGQLNLNKGCGQYVLAENFYTVVQVKSLLGGMHDRYIFRKEPVHIMLNIMGLDIVFNNKINYKIKGCTP